MRDDGFEIFDVNDDMHALLHMEVFEINGMDCDGGFERLLEDLCKEIVSLLLFGAIDYSYAVHPESSQ